MRNPRAGQYLEILAVVDHAEAAASPQGRPVLDALRRHGPGLARWSVEPEDIVATASRLALAVAAGEVLRTSHNGLLPPSAAVARKARLVWHRYACGCAPFGWAATPVMSCAPSRLQRGQLVQLAALEDRSMCGHGFAIAAGIEARRFAQSLGWPPPGHPSAPQGGSPAPSTDRPA